MLYSVLRLANKPERVKVDDSGKGFGQLVVGE